MSARISRVGVLDIQVCAPKDWTDEQVIQFAESQHPCGTRGGWQIRKEGSKFLLGYPERVQCEEDPNNVHVMLDA